MIKFNETYSINDGQESIVFTEGKANSISGKYNSGTLTGNLDGNLLKATFHNQKNNSAGLIEFDFNENGFNAKWKQGLEEGPMRGKWQGSLKSQSDNNQSVNEKTSLSPEQLKWFEEDTWEFDNLPKEWLDSKEFMLAVVTNSGSSLEFASDKLKDDKEIVLQAIDNNPYAIEYASDKLKNDKEIVLAAVTNHASALEYASDKLKDDGEIMLAAVKKDGSALKYASDKLNGDPEIVLTAMSQASHAVHHVRSEAILKELAENSSVGGAKINFKVRYLVNAVQRLFEKKAV